MAPPAARASDRLAVRRSDDHAWLCVVAAGRLTVRCRVWQAARRRVVEASTLDGRLDAAEGCDEAE